jgi:hypothetical protein
MNRIKNKWWFVAPVLICTLLSSFWLFSSLGLGTPLNPLTIPRVVLLFIAVSFFERLYSHLVWAALLWVSPETIGEEKRVS